MPFKLFDKLFSELFEKPISKIGEGSGSKKYWPTGWSGIRFDGRVIKTGIDFEFTRNNTVSTYLESYDTNEPRFGVARQVNNLDIFETKINLAVASIDWLGSGWDADGITPLVCVYNKTGGRLIWYRGDDFTVQRTQDLGSPVDLLGGDVVTHRYAPTSGIIHEGLHIVCCERVVISSGNVDAVAFFYSQDYGATWTEVPNVTSDAVPGVPPNASSLGMERGARWAFANAYPATGLNDVTSAYFGWGDYLDKSDNPKGGQAGLFSASRTAVGQPWTLTDNRVIYDRWEAGDSGGLHCHGITVHPTSGVCYSFWGDVGYRNEVIGHWFDDGIEQYDTSAITLQRNAQGGYDATATLYQYGSQSAGFAPGPYVDTALGTCDENPERFMLITPTDSSSPVKLTPIQASLTNSAAGSGSFGRTSLWIHRLRGKGWTAREIGAGSITGNDNRMWFSPDGLNWGKVPNKYGGTPHLFGNWLIAEVASVGVVGRPIPRTKTASPLKVYPGGTNLCTTTLAQQSAAGGSNTVNAVYIDEDGVFRYTVGDAALSPQPESLPLISPDCPIIELTVTDANRDLGRRWVQAAGQTTNFANRHWLKAWVYPLYRNALFPTFQFGTTGGGNITTERGYDAFISYGWQAVNHYGKPTNNPVTRALVALRQLNLAANRWLFALESMTMNTLPPYELAPGQVGNNELAVVSGLESSSNWSAFLSFQVPSDAWDAWAVNQHGEVILATIRNDSSNHIQLVYDQSALNLIVRITNASVVAASLTFSTTYLSKEDQIHIIISCDGTNTQATLSLPQNGSQALSSATTANILTALPTEIALSNPDKTVVVPCEWLSIGYSATYQNQSARESLLESLI